MATELRVRTVLALLALLMCVQRNSMLQQVNKHVSDYLQFSGHPYNLQPNVSAKEISLTYLEQELTDTLRDNAWCGMTQICGLSTALQMPIMMTYPYANIAIRDKFNTVVQPWDIASSMNIPPMSNRTFLLTIMWSGYIDQLNWFHANHFVPLVNQSRIALVLHAPTPGIHPQTTKEKTHKCEQMMKVKQKVHFASKRKNDNGTQDEPQLKTLKSRSNTYPCGFTCSDKLPWIYCFDCQVLITGKQYTYKDKSLCITCFKLNTSEGHKTLANIYPGDVPKEIRKLNSTEIQLISRVHPYMNLAKLPAGGQMSLNGQSINFPIPVQHIADQLPADEHILLFNASAKKADVICIDNIHQALQWLKRNNKYYTYITLRDVDFELFNNTVCGKEQDQNIDINLIEVASMQHASLIPKDYILPCNAKDLQHMKHFKLPVIPTRPINIFQDIYIEALAFPHLFPYGENIYADLREEMTMQQYFIRRHLHKNRHWSTCIPYLFWSLNVYEQHKLQQSISVALRLNAGVNVTAAEVLTNSAPPTSDDYCFMKTIKGTTAYWREQLFDLLAKIKLLGAPTFFLTLSSNDSQWNEMYKFINPSLTEDDIINLPTSEKIALVNNNPVYSALYFSKRWETYLSKYILGPTRPLGKVSDYFARIEFQNRGSPHVHAFFWIEDSPDMETIDGRRKAVKFIDKYISAKLPEDKDLLTLVQNLQTHRHTASCLKGGSKKICRYDFPRQASNQTKVQITNISTTTGRFYTLERDQQSLWINPYNIDILSSWQSNMDIQVVGCKHAAAVYVCSYVCKNEPIELKTLISNTIQKLPQDATPRKRLSKIGNVLLTHRLISSQEATYRLLNMHMVYSSRATIYINAKKQTERYRKLKPKSSLLQMPQDSTEVFEENMHELYSRRPSCLNDMCLAKFATHYTKVNKREKLEQLSDKALPRHRLQGNSEQYIRQRKKPTAFRSYIPNMTKHPEGHYYALLCLFHPWKEEKDLLSGYDSAKTAFKQKQSGIDLEFLEQYNYSETLEKAIQEVRQLQEEIYHDVQCRLLPAFAENNGDEPQSTPNHDSVFQFANYEPHSEAAVQNQTYSSSEFKALAQFTMSNEQYEKNIQSLTKEQEAILDIATSDFDSQKLIFITGGAGTGKSYLLKIIREKHLRDNKSDYPNVLVAAPTGTAAFNVNGWTLHTLLYLNVTHNKYVKYTNLSDKPLAKLRTLFKNVRTLIIDEISMVSIQMLLHIHLRLSEIKDTQLQPDTYFGGLTVLAFGDLFQLKPVFGSYVFGNHVDIPGTHVWKDLFYKFELQQNFRQQTDVAYAQTLNRIRVGQHTEADIKLLQERITLTTDYAVQHIFPIRESCKQHNKICTANYLQQKAATITAIDEPDIPNIPKNDSECAGLPKTIEICKGSRVMLLRNIMTSEGLVNGAQGSITNITWENNVQQHDGELPSSVHILFDDHRVGAVHLQNEHNPIEVKPITVVFQIQRTKQKVHRTQLPISESFGVTIHKVQGQTLNKACVDIGGNVFAGGMAYVALSRVSTMEGLTICNFDPGKLYPPKNISQELENMKTLQID